jgi:hypothetical protein
LLLASPGRSPSPGVSRAASVGDDRAQLLAAHNAIDRSEQRVDERCQNRSLGEYRYGPVNHSHDHERQQPELLPVYSEAPQIDKNAQRDPLLSYLSFVPIMMKSPPSFPPERSISSSLDRRARYVPTECG